MKKVFHLSILILTLFSLHCCDMLELHPYDAFVRGERNLTEKNITLLEEKLKDKKAFRFAFISDTQRWYDETKDMVADINKRKDIDFVIHGGDISDFGATHEFILQRDIMLKFNMPWFALLGNHDPRWKRTFRLSEHQLPRI